MNTRTYPYNAWTVNSAGVPVEVVLVRKSSGWGDPEAVFDRTETGKAYDSTKLRATKTLAIIAALEEVDAREANLKRQMARQEKKRAALEKARTEA